jgi:hypothetical protein
MDDGTAKEFAGVVGNELMYAIDFTGLEDFAQKCGGIS